MSLAKNERGPERASVHKTFQRNERAIQKALNSYISDREFGVCVRDVCRDTGLSSPTFYAHNANIKSAYQNYERGLIKEFIALISERPVRSLILALLLSFAYCHRDYFRATSRNSDFCTLGRILDRVRFSLVGTQISDQSFLLYRNEIASVIMIWAKIDHFRKNKLDFYLRKISRIRVQEW